MATYDGASHRCGEVRVADKLSPPRALSPEFAKADEWNMDIAEKNSKPMFMNEKKVTSRLIQGEASLRAGLSRRQASLALLT